jgi:hypothetical protein
MAHVLMATYFFSNHGNEKCSSAFRNYIKFVIKIVFTSHRSRYVPDEENGRNA